MPLSSSSSMLQEIVKPPLSGRKGQPYYQFRHAHSEIRRTNRMIACLSRKEGTIEVGVDGVEHLVDLSLLKIAPQLTHCPHELLSGHLTAILPISHPEYITQSEA